MSVMIFKFDGIQWLHTCFDIIPNIIIIQNKTSIDSFCWLLIASVEGASFHWLVKMC